MSIALKEVISERYLQVNDAVAVLSLRQNGAGPLFSLGTAAWGNRLTVENNGQVSLPNATAAGQGLLFGGDTEVYRLGANIFGLADGDTFSLRTALQLRQLTANYTVIWADPAAARQLTIPAVGGDRTFAFLEQAQTFTAIQTFAIFPVTPSAAPTTDYQVANKKYVDDQPTKVVYGTYTGDGTDARQIPTGAQCKLVILQWSTGAVIPTWIIMHTASSIRMMSGNVVGVRNDAYLHATDGFVVWGNAANDANTSGIPFTYTAFHV